MTKEYEISEVNRVRQLRELAHYDADSVHAILDAGLVVHVGFAEDGRPCVIPMLYGRDGESLYLHVADSRVADDVKPSPPMARLEGRRL